MSTLAAAPTTTVRLLDYDPELARDLREERRDEASRTALAPTLTVPRGAWDGVPPDVVGACPYGLLVLEGLLSRTVMLGGDQPSTQLLGEGDLIRPEPEDAAALVPVTVHWTVLDPVKLAILDERFLLTVRRWPEIVAALFERVAAQSSRLGTHRALCQLPRVEDRLHALLWFLAERWGRVTPQGVVLPIKLTQEVLGQLIGAKRPTVSLAIKELEKRGTVLRRGDGAWLLEESWSWAEGTAALTLPSAGFVRHEPGSPTLASGNGARRQRGDGNGNAATNGNGNGRLHRNGTGNGSTHGSRIEARSPTVTLTPAVADLQRRIERMRERHERSIGEVSALLARSAATQQRSAELRDRIAHGRKRRG
ncbi:MAG TPA: helix-turn-helix domain-containing protein [Conexibacter sp.]|nr:helix-turn-helix domain-containing protein [Conexibacter sp.]